MMLNLLLAAMVGLAVPLMRHKLHLDPAMGTSVLLTAITDGMGFSSSSAWHGVFAVSPGGAAPPPVPPDVPSPRLGRGKS